MDTTTSFISLRISIVVLYRYGYDCSFISLRILYSFISLRILEPKHIRLDSTALRAQCSAEMMFLVKACGHSDLHSARHLIVAQIILVVLHRYGCQAFGGDVV